MLLKKQNFELHCKARRKKSFAGNAQFFGFALQRFKAAKNKLALPIRFTKR
jgi:hypothetical protein